MQLRTFFLLFTISVAQAVAAKDNEEFVPAQHALSRDLKVRKNENCRISGEISCMVQNENRTDCKDLIIQMDECEKLPVLMNYTFCNHEVLAADQIIVLPSLSYTDLYEQDRKRLVISTLPAGQCRSQMKAGIVDTCTRNRVNADMKLEGWKKFRRNYGHYCHVYKHYFPLIRKVLPRPSFEVVTLCYVESVKGNGDFTVPCDDIDLEYFLNSLRAMMNRDVITGTSTNNVDYERNVKYEFVVKSSTGEEVTVDDIKVTIDGETFVIPVADGKINIPKGGSISVGEFQKEIDFSKYSGGNLEVTSDITVTGKESGQLTTKTTAKAVSVPLIEFKFRINYLRCVIEGSGKSCEDYVAQLPTVDDEELCEVDVEYYYEVENIGETCENITNIEAMVDNETFTIQASNWNFCPGDIETVVDAREDNLCDYADREVDFDLKMKDFLAGTTLTFPKPAGIGPILTMLDFRCEIANVIPKRTCNDYIKFSQEENLPCSTDVVYRTKVENTGDACMNINKLQLGVGSDAFVVPSKNWSADKKEFCPTEVLNLQKKVLNVTLCDMANSEVDVMVSANKGDFSDVGSIEFRGPNTITSAPAPAPVPTPPTNCSTKPNSITFKLNRALCKDSSNSQGIERKRRLKGASRGKGSQPVQDCECQKCLDHNKGINGCSGTPLVTISKKDERDGSTVELFKGNIEFGVDFVFTPSPTIPDCLQIDIHDDDGKDKDQVQVVSFDMTCSVAHPLNVGDTFGAVEITKIN